jgi:cytochrome c2
MLSAGRWPETQTFWVGFLNPTFLPSAVSRTGGALAITGLYIMMHVTFTQAAPALRARVVAWASRWALIGIVLIAMGGAWWFFAAPEYVRIKLLAAPAVLIISIVSIGVTTALTVGVGLGPASRSSWLVPPFAALLFLLGSIGLFSGEFLREAGRKPYTIENYLYSNNLRVADVAAVSELGYVNANQWVRAHLQQQVPQLFNEQGLATSSAAAALASFDRHQVGQAIYENQCGTCHTRRGYNALMPRLSAANVETTGLLVMRMDQVSHAMPPWAGQDWEAEVLAEFLNAEAKGAVQ